jgi:hypothetical protein
MGSGISVFDEEVNDQEKGERHEGRLQIPLEQLPGGKAEKADGEEHD